MLAYLPTELYNSEQLIMVRKICKVHNKNYGDITYNLLHCNIEAIKKLLNELCDKECNDEDNFDDYLREQTKFFNNSASILMYGNRVQNRVYRADLDDKRPNCKTCLVGKIGEYSVQIRRGDEPSSTVYACDKCGYRKIR